jgi:hypothetical protein
MNESSTTPATGAPTVSGSVNQSNGGEMSRGNIERSKSDKNQKDIEMAKEYQKVTRSLAREISKKDGFSLVSVAEESKVEPIPEEPVKEPEDGLLTQTTFKSATFLLLSMEVQ